jgi:two-component system, HptB-dependent secretion and biofilm response regulator
MKMLLVDDDATNRLVLSAYLKKDGHSILVAENGQQAIDVYESDHPDMILMDVMMPIMDGYEATQIIKAKSEKCIPIIFLTAMTDENALAKCVEVGGDDFLTKPYSRVILHAKIEALTRVSKLYNTVYEQNEELEHHNIQQLQEQNVANKVFNSIMHKGCLDESIFNIHLSPVSLFNGDVVLAAVRPTGGLNILFGDFTGHGLGAALGALPLSEIFYAMTAKGYGVADILQEINQKLKQQLPMGMFLAACVVELDPVNNIVKIWNGAIPGAYILRATGALFKIKSKNLPFAILASSEFSNETDIIEIFDGDKIILTTDGILEAENPLGEMYGTKRFEKNLLDIANEHRTINSEEDKQSLMNEMIASVDDYAQDQAFNDDITLGVIDCDFDAIDSLNTEKVKDNKIVDSHWEFSFLLYFDTLQKIDPLPILNQILSSIMGKRESSSQINMILSELFCNSLDHGLLGLDSSIKSTPIGFMEFYEQKSSRLEKLDKGYLKISLKNKKSETGSMLTISFEDSGQGFDTSKLDKAKDMEANEGYSGRGYPLIKNFSESVKYNNAGNKIEIEVKI